MNRITTITLGVVVVLVGIGVVYLATSDLPPPSATVEKVIPDDRFSR